MENREASCADRLPAHLASRIEDLAKLNRGEPIDPVDADADADDVMEAVSEQLFEYPLGVSVETVLRVDLSTGGPADWLELFYRSADDGRPHRIVYHFTDWFDHAEITLDDAAFDAVEQAFGEWIEYQDGGRR